MTKRILTDYWENGNLRLKSIWMNEDESTGVIYGWSEEGSREFEITMRRGIPVARKVFA